MPENIDYINNKKIIVIGLGKTGTSVIKKIIPFCRFITAYDSNEKLSLDKDFLKFIKEHSRKIRIILGDRGNDAGISSLQNQDMVIVSPGIPSDNYIIREAGGKNIPILSEIELAWNLLEPDEKKNTIAVTGTNGKTTTVNLIGHIFSESKRKNMVCGNVGLPLIETLELGREKKNRAATPETAGTTRIIEVSSFQLERIKNFKPAIAIVLNITSDHIDRHGTIDAYGNLKFEIFRNQDASDYSILNIDDYYVAKILDCRSARRLKASAATVMKMSIKHPGKADVFYSQGAIILKKGGNKEELNIVGAPLTGTHNIYNMIASAAACLLSGINAGNIEKSIKSFQPLPHRLEFVAEINGIKCFNDSKSTNPDATAAALASFDGKVTLILGGRDKGMDFGCAVDIMKRKVNNFILIGELKNKLYEFIIENMGERFKTNVFKCGTMKEAVDTGLELARKGEILLLSPGCASMDMFRDYRQRGDIFRELILSRL